jgi:hypothetical protein
MKKKDILPTLYKKYNKKENFKTFIDKLIEKVKNNETISDNGLLDGFIIGLIHSNSGYIWRLLFTEEVLPPMSDNTIQQCEQCVKWIINNEEILNKL